jgi:Family of unknown function (DUF6334)
VGSTKLRTAEALYPFLSAFHAVSDRTLRAVRHVVRDGSLERVILDCGSVCLVFFADENDDTISIAVEDTRACERGSDQIDVGESPVWRDFVGKSFGWGWLIVNQQGYCDGALLSFGGIVPQLLLNVIASSIKVRVLVAAPT